MYYGCIYKIQNKITGQIYIGQTVRENPEKRINFHFKKSKHNQYYFQRSIQKYGKDNFDIELLYTAFDLETLNENEIFFIKHFNSLFPNGYNLKFGGQQGGKCSDETKKKIGDIRRGVPSPIKGRPKTLEHRQRMSEVRKGFTSENRRKAHKETVKKLFKPVVATNIITNQTFSFTNITEAANVLNVPAYNISRVCNGRQGRTQAGGFRFKFTETSCACG